MENRVKIIIDKINKTRSITETDKKFLKRLDENVLKTIGFKKVRMEKKH